MWSLQEACSPSAKATGRTWLGCPTDSLKLPHRRLPAEPRLHPALHAHSPGQAASSLPSSQAARPSHRQGRGMHWMAPLRQENCPGLQRSSVGANAGALSASPGRTQGSGGARGRSREQEGPPGAGAQAGRCPDLQARGPGCDKARPALKGRTEAEASGSTWNGTQQDRRACPDRHLPSACPGSPRGRPGAGWPLQSDPKLEI